MINKNRNQTELYLSFSTEIYFFQAKTPLSNLYHHMQPVETNKIYFSD
jgi:hypothetical protein